MVYTYTPTYYSTLHDSITSLCKTILPFSFKKKRLPVIAAAEQKLSKLQSDNLKWQQESFHQILKLMGLCKEGIVPETEVSAFKTHLLETLIASPVDYEQPMILRDKLIFLQELLYAKCISEDEYHSSKRPLLQRLAVQGVDIEARDVVVAGRKESSNDEWTEIDLKDERSLLGKETSNSKNQSKQGSSSKQIKGAASVLGFISSNRNAKTKEEKGVLDRCNENIMPNDSNMKNELGISTDNPFWNSHLGGKESETKSILMPESLPSESVKVEKQSGGDRAKRKPFRALFQKDQREEEHGDGSDNRGTDPEEKAAKSGKKQWPFDGFKKWKKSDPEDETAPLSLSERSDREAYFVGSSKLVANPVGEGPDTKQIKRKLHPSGAPSDFFVDKVLGDKIKKELSRIQTELSTNSANVHFTDEQIEAISTRLPVDKADLKKFFPKSWCDRYGDVVLDVVRKEFKDHVGEMGNLQGIARERPNSKKWATFDDAGNSHPNHSATRKNSFYMNQAEQNPRIYTNSSSIDKGFKYNPFFDV